MSDLAVIDVEDPAPTPRIKAYALVGRFGDSIERTDATLSALLQALPGEPVIVASTDKAGRKRHDDRVVNDADAVIVVSPVFGHDIKTTARLSKLALRAKLHGQTVAFVNASAQPAGSSAARFLMRNAVQHADLTIVRDEESADALLEAGVEGPLRIGADPAWSELSDLFAAPEQRERVVVALNDETIDVDFMSELLAPVADSGFEVLLQPWHRSQDVHGVIRRVGGNVSVADRPANLREARDLYSTSRGVLALRSHALMAATSVGAPTVAVGDTAMQRFAGSLGVPSASNGIEPTTAAKVFLETLEHGTVGSRAVPQIIDRAKATVDLVRLLLTEGEDLTQSANNPLPLYPKPWR